jgi:hypothetical protein
LDDVEPYLRGHIGFIRAADTGIIINHMSRPYQGIPHTEKYTLEEGVVYESQLITWDSEMSEFQKYYYKQSQRASELRPTERQAANFIFPDGYWGSGESKSKASRVAAPIEGELFQEEAPRVHGFPAFVEHRGGVYRAKPGLAERLNNIDSINEMGCKFAEITRLVANSPGNCFVYGEFVEGSGAIVLSLCLEGIGFERYNESSSIFVGTGITGVKPVCPSGDSDPMYRKVRSEITKKPRYALLTNDITDAKFHSMMEAINSRENMHGEYIKALVSSRVGRDAINVNNVRQIHIIGGEWTPSALYQAESRGLRATSHDDILAYTQREYIKHGLDPALARVEVEIYKHAAIDPDEPDNSVDLIMFRTAEYKDRNIRRIMHMAKQCAVGCQVHYNRNVTEQPLSPDTNATQFDGTAKCDYAECRYVCYDADKVLPTDYSTYDVLYADEIIMDVTEAIINIFREHNSMTIDELVSNLTYRRKYIVMGVEMLITNKTPIIDRFGYNTYLIEDDGTFYLDRTYPLGIKPSYPMSYYTRGVIAIEQSSLAKIVGKFGETAARAGMLDIFLKDPNNPDFNEAINSMTIDGRAVILEQAIIESITGNATPAINAILLMHRYYTYRIHEPVRELEQAHRQANLPIPKPGRKADPTKQHRVRKFNAKKLESVDYNENVEDEEVYLHTLYSQKAGNYAKKSRAKKAEGIIRIYKPSEITGGWRDIEMGSLEFNVYNPIIQLKIAEYEETFNHFGYYGFVALSDDPRDRRAFHIVDKVTQDPAALSGTSAKSIHTGQSCATWTPTINLVDILYHIGAPPPFSIWNEVTEANLPRLTAYVMSYNKSVAAEVSSWPYEKIAYYYKWYVGLKGGGQRITRDVLCAQIRNHMARTDRLM